MAVAAGICRGSARLLRSLNYAVVPELTLRSGRRADLVAVGPTGEVLIVEVKSSVADYRADNKWQEYRSCCDRLLFAVSAAFPTELVPADVGLIIADAYGGALIRDGKYHPLAAASRKGMLIAAARCAAWRLASMRDPFSETLELEAG